MCSLQGEVKYLKDKMNKAERLSFLTKVLVENPSQVFTLQYFSELLECAKSTLSEDFDVIGKLFVSMEVGQIFSISGALGGVYFSPTLSSDQIQSVKEELCDLLNDKKRIITGGYLYMNDLFYDPKKLKKIARSMVTQFAHLDFDYVVTIETKGIPLAIILASLLNKPVVVVRKSARLTEGPTIQMNYITASRSIKTMALPIKSIERKSKILFVDDFMKAGGTAKGVIDLMKEFEVEVVGVAVVMATKEPVKKLIEHYYALIEFDGINEETQTVRIFPKN
ncbi:MAG: pur operon repressor [Vallitaleaceae bacterium]|nr:pur operon repressor [Vallitaleaceae bacterium]